MGLSRRAFLRTSCLLAPVLLRAGRSAEAASHVSVRTHGARGDRRTKDTLAIQAAIDAAATAGREVLFPAGEYRSGTLRLRHGTTLRLDAGATLVASSDDSDFDRPEVLGYKTFADNETSDFGFALLQGRAVKGVRILGSGRIDGNRDTRDGPKPIALKECRDVEIGDVTIANAGSYNVSLLGCRNVNIHDVTILNGYADGIDPDCCHNVRIARCRVESRDDALCLKASFALGARLSTENVRVVDCQLSTRHNAIKLGTESTGDFRNIAISDCSVIGRRYPWKGDLTSGISLEAVDGGILEHVTIWDIRMAHVRVPIFVRHARRGRSQREPTPGALRDVSIRNIVASGALVASSITGLPEHVVERIALRNIRIAGVGGGDAELMSLRVPDFERRYPDATMFPDFPAYGLYCRHVAGLTIADLELTVGRADARPAVALEGVRDARIRTLRAPTPDGAPLLWFRDVRDARLHDLRAGMGPYTVARLSGAATTGVRIERSDNAQVVAMDREVQPSALRIDDPLWREVDPEAVSRSPFSPRARSPRSRVDRPEGETSER